MRTVRMKVYKFQELSEQAKQKVLADLWDINLDHNWWEYVYEDAERIDIKITEVDIGYKFCDGKFITNALECAKKIKKEHGKETATYLLAQNFLVDYGRIKIDSTFEGDEDDEIEKISDDFIEALMREYANILSNEYDYLQSKEAIIATIEANEYEFTSDGKQYVK